MSPIERPTLPETDVDSLNALFAPQSVAVVGASRKPSSIAGVILRNLLKAGFTGPVYPINPSSRSVHGVRAYASLGDVPDEIDLVIIAIPRDAVMPVLQDCADKGVKGAVVITAGFGETGPEGKALQDEMLKLCRASGIRLVGPNCFGLLNSDDGICLNGTFAPTWPPAGSVSFSSQSGALGLVILEYANDLGIGVRHFISVGNKADVSGNDLLEYWEADEATKVVLLYLESFGNPARFMRTARRLAAKKPIVVVKSGRTESGARAASSHTGSLAGMDVAVDALFDQTGVIRTDTIEELFDTAMLLANQPIPQGNRVAILTNAGGPAIMASDACESRGLEVATLSDETQNALHAFLPSEASARNPVDMVASATGESFERGTEILLADPAVDSLLVLFVPPIITEATDVAQGILRAAAGSNKPVLTCLMGTHGIPEALRSLRDSHFPSYAFPEAAALALARATRYGEWLHRPRGTEGNFDVDKTAAEAVLETVCSCLEPAPAATPGKRAHEGSEPRADGDSQNDAWLTPTQIKQVFGAYGINMATGEVAASEDEAVGHAASMGFPVVVKLVSDTISHKSDVGGVVLGVADEKGVRAAWQNMASRLSELGKSDAMQGVLVQPMITGGVETFVGMTLDPSFGPLLAFGIGGVQVEVWRDVAFRVHPITDIDAGRMLDEIRGKKLLDGFRGAPAADKAALIETLLRVSRLVGDHPRIAEIDINPLVAREPGAGVIALDARIRVQCTPDCR